MSRYRFYVLCLHRKIWNSQQTPLHLAVRGDEIDMVRHLLLAPGCKMNIIDEDGNTPLHLASVKPHHLALAAILMTLPSVNNKEDNIISKIINQYNYQGVF